MSDAEIAFWNDKRVATLERTFQYLWQITAGRGCLRIIRRCSSGNASQAQATPMAATESVGIFQKAACELGSEGG